MLLRFLADYRDERLREGITQWLAGTLTGAQEGEGRGRAMMADELAVLEWDDIRRFYGLGAEPPEEEGKRP